MDDDPQFVEMLAARLARSFEVQPFGNAHTCASFLLQEAVWQREDLVAQQRILTEWRLGAALIPSVLKYWYQCQPTQRMLTKVLVADDHMPEMLGLELLTRLHAWPGKRLLLCTKPFDEEAVARALDNGLIDELLGKDNRNFGTAIHAAVRNLYESEDKQCRQLWAMTLTTEQATVLDRQDIVSSLHPRLENDFAEWFVLGQPFGVIGRDHKGKPSWLPLTLGLQGHLLAAVSNIDLPPDAKGI